ncbi:MAG: hypothetical protein WBB19_10305 [Desulforhopalus sp.]
MKWAIIIVLVVNLSSCSNLDRAVRKLVRPTPINGVCAKEGNAFDIGRYKFSINLNPDWEYSLKPWDQSVSFHYLKDGIASAINTNSYINHVYWLEEYWHDPELIRQAMQQFYDDHTSRKPRNNPFYDLRIVKKAGLVCVREEERWTAPTPYGAYNTSYNGGLEDHLSYICVVPGQLERRPIDIGIAQSTGGKATPLNLEAILTPILESLVLNPNPPPLPENY